MAAEIEEDDYDDYTEVTPVPPIEIDDAEHWTGVVSAEFYDESPGPEKDRTVSHGLPPLEMRAVESLALEVSRTCLRYRGTDQERIVLALFRFAIGDDA